MTGNVTAEIDDLDLPSIHVDETGAGVKTVKCGELRRSASVKIDAGKKKRMSEDGKLRRQRGAIALS